MLNEEVAAIAYFFAPLGQKEYFGELQEGAIIPAIYFPAPDITGTEASLTFYKDQFSLFVKFIDKDSVSAFVTAREALRMVQEAKKTMPLYDQSGNPTGKSFYIKNADVRIIDTGVAQLTLTWDRYDDYDETRGVLIVDVDSDVYKKNINLTGGQDG